MTLNLKRQSVKQQGLKIDESEIPRLDEQGDYRSITDQIDALRSRLEEAERQRNAWLEEKRLAHSPVTFIKTVLDDTSQNGASLGERIAALGERIRDLRKALQLAEQERDRIRGRLSAEATASLSAYVRAHARNVLRGMLDVHLANESIVAMREALEAKGYQAGTIVPVGVSPWPAWGQVLDPGSVWRMVLAEFRERQFITMDEYAAMVAGDLMAFRP